MSGPATPVTPGTARSLAASVVLAAAAAVAVAVANLSMIRHAAAFDLPPVGGIDATGGEDEKKITLDVGVHFGSDSNVRRAAEGSPEDEDDTVLEILGGAAFWSGNGRRRFDLRAQFRADQYSDLSDRNFEETTVLAGAQFGGRESPVRAVIRGGYVSLGDPNDIDLPQAPKLISRTRTSFAPRVDIRRGKLELGLGYFASTTDYDEVSYDYLDNEDGSFRTELRWGRSDRQQLFAHLDFGDVDYPDGSSRRDIEYTNIYFGWRTEASRLGFELAAGPSSVEAGLTSGSEFYAAARANLLGERRSLLLGVVRGPEAAARADYKVATRLHVRYLQQMSTRLSWSIGMTSEGIELVESDAPDLSSIDRLIVNAGLAWELGSPGGTHGRLYLSVNREQASGDSTVSYDDYVRTRILLGVALVR